MTSKINVWKIVRDHVDTLRDDRELSLSRYDLAVFFVVPACAALLHLALSSPLAPDKQLDVSGIVVSAFSIFAALLFNVQVLIIGLREKTRQPIASAEGKSPEDLALSKRKAEDANLPLKELFANVSYAILVAMAIVALTLISVMANIGDWRIVRGLQFFGTIHFALTSVMVLKRMHVVFSNIQR